MKDQTKFLRRVVLVLLGISIIILLYSYFKKDDLPEDLSFTDSMFLDPQQEELFIPEVTIQIDEYNYTLTPHYSYELYGLVVAEYDAEHWADMAHEHDPLNTKDLCVVWGENLKTDVYSKMNFSHGEWTCYYKTNSDEVYSRFSAEQFSNNHLLPSTDEIYDKIKNSRIGDQIYIRGYLVDYSIQTPDGQTGSRETSSVRNDTGCEIIYVNDFNILSSANTIYQTLFTYSKIAVLVFVLLFLFFLVLS
jgi:hypothetical protein